MHVKDSSPDKEGKIRTNFSHYVSNKNAKFLHINLFKGHFTPLIPVQISPNKHDLIYKHDSSKGPGQSEREDGNEDSEGDNHITKRDKQEEVQRPIQTKISRPPRARLKLSTNPTAQNENIPPLNQIKISQDHPFLKNINLVYFITADAYPSTEILKALEERDMINLSEIKNQIPGVGVVIVSKYRKNKLMGLVLKPHIHSYCMKVDLNKCLKILVNLIGKLGLKDIALTRDIELKVKA